MTILQDWHKRVEKVSLTSLRVVESKKKKRNRERKKGGKKCKQLSIGFVNIVVNWIIASVGGNN